MKTSRVLLLSSAVVAASFLGGCANYYYGDKGGPGAGSWFASSLVQRNHEAADKLVEGVLLQPQLPLLVGTVVHIDHLHESSRLGRLVSEQLAARLAQRGLHVTELKLRTSALMRPEQGELLLSRELREVSQAQQAQAVVVGTYAPTAQQLFISLKLVRPQDGQILSAYDYALPMDSDVRSLLTGIDTLPKR
ncbi:hypothetical protein G7045_09305 [Acidovorax sp. HDW3]|uniref:FlgO family outer membrane protein n=1 Tax=Acidovorax sp. HDW3 TaxID=2714923 RepID=UPI0014072294|nr:FlgO family outer membrane protein [Acidovorax sp. HDW3]QIL44441.1 hypothetical protein G7045_09305 [Acidovorax sp. HDW3]